MSHLYQAEKIRAFRSPWFSLDVIQVPGDGSCFFHSVLRAYDPRYQKSCVNCRKSRAHQLRQDLASWLQEPVTPDPSILNYHMINGGALASFAEVKSRYRLDKMKETLLSSTSVGDDFIDIIEEYFGITLWIIDSKTGDLYWRMALPDLRRPSVVLLYRRPNHFECLGLRRDDCSIQTLFPVSHPLAQRLRQRFSSRGREKSSKSSYLA